MGGDEIKEKKKQKKILIKRKFFSSGTYDYIWKDKKDGLKIIESTKEIKNRDYQFVRADKNIELRFRFKKFLKNKNTQKITWMIIGVLITILGKLLFNLLDIEIN